MKYKPKSLRRRRNTDKWECVLSHTDPITGDDVSTYHTIVAKTRKQAEQIRCDLIVQMELEGSSVSTDITVSQFMDYYLKYKSASKTIEPSTIRDYRYEANKICKYIGAEKIDHVTIAVVDNCLAKMSADGYAPKTIAKCFRLFKQALNYAIAQDILKKNPCDFCKPPKRRNTPINTLSREERSLMLDIARRAQPSPLAVAIEIILTTGMRRAEVCALRWSDFNEAKRTITVNHSLGKGEGGFYLKDPKSGRTRTLPLTSHTFNLLQGMYEDIKSICRKLKIGFDDLYILGTLDAQSRPYSPDRIGKDFAAFCKMNGFDCSLHDLRHTFATFMIADGADIVTVANYLGHANPSVTLDVYADVDPEAKLRAVKYIEGAFDDADSVLRREIRQRREEIEQAEQSSPGDSDKTSSTSADSITFTIEEMEAMLTMLKAAS